MKFIHEFFFFLKKKKKSMFIIIVLSVKKKKINLYKYLLKKIFFSSFNIKYY